MAVAVKNTPETSPGRLLPRLAVDSLVGALYVVFSLGVVFTLLPWVWWQAWTGVRLPANSPAGWALLLVIGAAALGGLAVFGWRLAGSPPPHGLRAGVAFGFVGLVVAFLLTCWMGRLLEGALGEASAGIGAVLTAVVALALLAGLVWLLALPRVENLLLQVEDQGWFSAAAYKRNQAQRVRRGTILGILILALCGVYTLWSHKTLQGVGDWLVTIPFTGGWAWPLLLQAEFTVPILLTLATFWLAYRVVNYPTFADFLIATEAELNKISWTTRKRLVQDTIVVLATVILLTLFLFVVDQLWAVILTRIHVLQPPPPQNTNIQTELPW